LIFTEKRRYLLNIYVYICKAQPNKSDTFMHKKFAIKKFTISLDRFFDRQRINRIK